MKSKENLELNKILLPTLLALLLGASGCVAQPTAAPYPTHAPLSAPASNCPEAAVGSFMSRALDPLREFLDLYTVAADTPRLNMPGVITQMQAVRRRFQALSYPPCLETYVSLEVESMDEAIAGHLAFMGKRSNEVVLSHFKKSLESNQLGQKVLDEVLARIGE